jgi:cyclopropane-fatty-acyl-phospholipid synthase
MKQSLSRMVATRYGGRNIPVALVMPDGGRVTLAQPTEVDIHARTWNGLRALASPEMGRLARAYVRGDLDFSGGARRILGIAENLVGSVSHGRERMRGRALQWLHQHRSNRANIQHHYDVSDAFYKLWLDSRMVYSCAYFRSDADSLDLAQLNKLDHVCRKLQLAPGDEFLDIGCGWGALIFRAAEAFGVRATGITLSRNQYEHVRREIAARGLTDRVEVRLQDYQDLPPDRQYDKIASIGMFEHVGIRNYPRYFGTIWQLLRPGGMVLNHGITQNGVEVEGLGSGISEFVEEFVFPGGQLAHVSTVIEGMAREGLELVDAEALREHYARTLWQWLGRLEQNADVARAEVGEEKYRVWRIYLAGSAHSFDRGWLSIFQLLAGKPFPDGRLPHPATRDYMYRP